MSPHPQTAAGGYGVTEQALLIWAGAYQRTVVMRWAAISGCQTLSTRV